MKFPGAALIGGFIYKEEGAYFKEERVIPMKFQSSIILSFRITTITIISPIPELLLISFIESLFVQFFHKHFHLKIIRLLYGQVSVRRLIFRLGAYYRPAIIFIRVWDSAVFLGPDVYYKKWVNLPDNLSHVILDFISDVTDRNEIMKLFWLFFENLLVLRTPEAANFAEHQRKRNYVN